VENNKIKSLATDKAEETIIFTLESCHPIDAVFKEKGMSCHLNEFRCTLLVDLGEGVARLARAILGLDDGVVCTDEYCRLLDNQLLPCIDVVLSNPAIQLDETLLTQLKGLMEKYCHMMTSDIRGVHQQELWQDPTQGQLFILKNHVDIFLTSHEGKKITTPIRFVGNGSMGVIAGKFLSPPKQDWTENPVRSISAYCNGFKIASHELYLLYENGRPEMVYFDCDEHLEGLIELIGTRHIMNRFVIQERPGVKRQKTFKLLEICEHVGREGEFAVI